MPITQLLILKIPNALLALMIVGGAVLFSVLGLLLVRRLIHRGLFKEHHDVAGPIFGVLGAVYAVGNSDHRAAVLPDRRLERFLRYPGTEPLPVDHQAKVTGERYRLHRGRGAGGVVAVDGVEVVGGGAGNRGAEQAR